MKKALLVVSFGSTYPDAVRESILPVEEAMKGAFPDRVFRRAFGSKMILRKLQKRDGISIPSIREALEALAAEGYEDVLIQPTYFIPGTEYTELMDTARDYAPRFQSLKTGKPLLDTLEDFETVMSGITGTFPLANDEALVLMGHGTEHFANAAYPALEHMIHNYASEKIFVGTVEGYPGISDVIKKLHAAKVKKVALTAFMLVAGDHARNDMAGDGDNSWKSILEKEGFSVSCILRGFGSYNFIQRMFIEHAHNAM